MGVKGDFGEKVVERKSLRISEILKVIPLNLMVLLCVSRCGIGSYAPLYRARYFYGAREGGGICDTWVQEREERPRRSVVVPWVWWSPGRGDGGVGPWVWWSPGRGDG